MVALILIAPLFLMFEFWQLFICERYVGIKQIERHGNPRTAGPNELTAFIWTTILFLYWAWMFSLLISTSSRVHGACLLLISVAGYLIRRGCGLKWILVVLTFEGAMRIGLLFSLCAYAWRRF